MKRKIDRVVEEVKEIDKVEEQTDSLFVSTGSTLLNLALTDKVDGGWKTKRIANLIGDHSTSKSLLVLTMLAEAANNSLFDNYELIYYEPEACLEFDLHKLFGSKMMKRVLFLPLDKSKPRTIQDWESDIFRRVIKGKKPIIEVLDSLDALTSEEELKDDSTNKGGFKTEKAAGMSTLCRKIVGMVESTNSLVVVVSQTRHKIGAMFGPTKTRSGGDALHFYSAHEVWLHQGPPITKTVRGYSEEIGNYVRARVTKNKITGKKREVEFSVFYEYGVDDIRSMIEWLISRGFWGSDKQKEGRKISINSVIDSNGVFPSCKFKDLMSLVESDNLENKLKGIVQDCWNEIENALLMNRKSKYE